MGPRFRDAEHLFRLAGLFAGGTALFLIARAILVPPGFGDYGHYRSGALLDNRQRTPVFAGRAACADCHGDAVAALAAAAHARIGCETCHGPLAAHAEDPGALEPAIADVTRLCSDCHAAQPARPAAHPQVDVAAHAEGSACTDCHEPHAPEP
jgi:hypothetical protein